VVDRLGDSVAPQQAVCCRVIHLCVHALAIQHVRANHLCKQW
jgi:hypothetical protein